MSVNTGSSLLEAAYQVLISTLFFLVTGKDLPARAISISVSRNPMAPPPPPDPAVTVAKVVADASFENPELPAPLVA